MFKTDNSENVLQEIADKLVDKFTSSGLMIQQYDKVKLHLTVINTLFRRNDVEDEEGLIQETSQCERQTGRNNMKSNRETLDARQILNSFESRCFIETDITEIHLSQLRAGRRTKENYYLPSAIISLTSCG